MTYNKFSFPVMVVCESDVDVETIKSALSECLAANVPAGAKQHVGDATVKGLSEQGYKVLRARVFGETAEEAGDAANPKPKKEAVAIA